MERVRGTVLLREHLIDRLDEHAHLEGDRKEEERGQAEATCVRNVVVVDVPVRVGDSTD